MKFIIFHVLATLKIKKRLVQNFFQTHRVLPRLKRFFFSSINLDIQIPFRENGKHKGHLVAKWLFDNEWKRYSVSDDALYFRPFVFLGRTEAKERELINPYILKHFIRTLRHS